MIGIETAIAKASGRRAFAASLNPSVSVQAVGHWVKHGWVPPARALEIERLYRIHRALLVKPALALLLDDQHRSLHCIFP